ncbi:MAG TPA: hypothetical protein VGM41_08870, partial [Chitinophagaceae bacterium]
MRRFLFMGLVLAFNAAIAQDNAGYQLPPKDIADLLLAKPTPAVSLDSKGEWLLLSERNSYPSVEELAQPEWRIAGLRFNPNNYALSRQNFVNNFILENIKSGKQLQVSGLPASLSAGNVSWSPGETKIAFTQTSNTRVDLYIIDVATQKATRINQKPLNTILGGAYTWVDDNTLLYKTALKPVSAAPVKPLLPKGPSTQENLGKVAPSRTFEDLIKTPYDEDLFAFYATAQPVKNSHGVETPVGAPSITSTFSLSPDKKYVLVRTVKRPFSYLVPAFEFSSTVSINDLNGKLVKVLAELPSGETAPSGFDNVQNAPGHYEWRQDVAATITWSHPLDSGRIQKKMDYHDAVYALSAPFTGEPKELFQVSLRYRNIIWGNDTLALVQEGSMGKQLTRTDRYNPATGSIEKLMERNTTDAYNNPGMPVLARNSYGREVLQTVDKGSKLLFNNPVGSSPNGDLPFLAKFDLGSKQTEIIWRCADNSYEEVADVIDANKLVLLTRRETAQDVPNYYIKNLVLRMADVAVTHFSNPYPQLEGITKEKISYKRADGVDLTGDLYLPKGYDAKRDGPLPVLIWAYPREFNSAADA